MFVNMQPPEKRAAYAGAYDVHSIFPTIQGEGPFVGRPAVFIRLAGCNLQCPGCDTEYTRERALLSPQQICKLVSSANLPGRLVVITGGEPFRQDLTQLFRELAIAGFHVQVETNGTLAPSDSMIAEMLYRREAITIVCSPKTGSVNGKLRPFIGAYKYVLSALAPDGTSDVNDLDGLPVHALHHPTGGECVARPPVGFTGPVYVQPMDVQDAHGLRDENAYSRNRWAAVDSCMKHGHTFCLQMHKEIGVD